jgi:hypothetical protein
MTHDNIPQFVETFRIFNNGIIKSKINSFYGLLSGYNALKLIVQNYEKKIAPSYNIFHILRNIYKDEERTHSPFLAHLLNPNGEHKQGFLFFNEFIKTLKLKKNITINETDFIKVETEKNTDDGSIDIIIEIFITVSICILQLRIKTMHMINQDN